LVIIQGYGTLLTPWHPVDFVIAYIILVLFVVVWVGWKLWHKTKLADLRTVDLQTGRREVLASDEEEEKPSLLRRTADAIRRR
jgi:yeast amino acid transporter